MGFKKFKNALVFTGLACGAFALASTGMCAIGARQFNS